MENKRNATETLFFCLEYVGIQLYYGLAIENNCC